MPVRYIIDTNVISELRTQRGNPKVVQWFLTVPTTQLYISVIVIEELLRGILRVDRHDRIQSARLRAWLDSQVLPRFKDHILPVDVAVATRCAALHVPNKRPELDSLIAATALVHNMTVVTRNVKDFEGTGVELVNPWE